MKTITPEEKGSLLSKIKNLFSKIKSWPLVDMFFDENYGSDSNDEISPAQSNDSVAKAFAASSQRLTTLSQETDPTLKATTPAEPFKVPNASKPKAQKTKPPETKDTNEPPKKGHDEHEL